MIIYAPWNRYCMIQRTRLWSTGLSTLKEEEKKAYIWTFGSVNNTMKYIVHQFSKIWSYLQKYYTNNGILCVKRVENLLSGGREPKNFGSGGHTSIRGGGCNPWWVWSPNSHPLILDSPGQIHCYTVKDLACCAVFSTATNKWGEGGGKGGGVIIEKYFHSFFTCFWVYRSFLSNKSFLQEKTGNKLVKDQQISGFFLWRLP